MAAAGETGAGAADDVVARAQAWLAGDPDPHTRAELQALLDASDHDELAERMLNELPFGTAGLRGIVGAGRARMNVAVVIRVTRALVEYLLSQCADQDTRPIVIGCDARLDSLRFADAAAAVVLAAGIAVKRFAQPVPTPLLAYAVRALAGRAGIMITASHNPAEYNGYKLYWENGVLVVPPVDAAIAAARLRVGPARAVSMGNLSRQELIGAGLEDGYLAAIRRDLPPIVADRNFAVVYTPLHGVGAAFVERAFSEAGYATFQSVPEQREPDGHFPTVPFPNPEEPGAIDLAIALATRTRADLVLANDPDVDRLAVAVPDANGDWLALTGNQIGLLLADFAMRHLSANGRPLLLSSLVSSPMLDTIGRAHGARCERVLTGFKWIWTAALALERDGYRYCFGYEEALGFAFSRSVRDKDGISAALAFAELTAEARAAGKTVLARLNELYREHGLWCSVQHSVVLAGSAGARRIQQAMQRVLEEPPTALAGYAVSALTDFQVPLTGAPSWRQPTPLIELALGDRGRVLIRPSGTEPKLKIYVDLGLVLSAEMAIDEAELQLRQRALAVARALASAIGLGGPE